MKLAFTILIIVMMLSIFNVKVYKFVDLSSDSKNSKVYLFVTCLVLIVLAGCRVGFVDTSTYCNMATRLGTDYANAFNSVVPTEVGFNLFVVFLNNLCNDNQFFIFVTTALTLSLVFYKIYKSSPDKSFSVLLFLFLYFYTYINGIRQSIAAAIIFCLYDRIKNNNFKMVFLCIILSLIHSSALLMIPMLYVVRGNVFNNKIKLLMCLALCAIFVPSITNRLFELVLNDKYLMTLDVVEKGTSAIRIIVNSVPCVLGLWFYYNKKDKLENEEVKMLNLILVDFAIVIFSISSTYFARMSIYTSIFSIIYMPYLIRKIFRKNSYLAARYIVILFYLVYFVYQTLVYYNFGYLREFTLFFM